MYSVYKNGKVIILFEIAFVNLVGKRNKSSDKMCLICKKGVDTSGVFVVV